MKNWVAEDVASDSHDTNTVASFIQGSFSSPISWYGILPEKDKKNIIERATKFSCFWLLFLIILQKNRIPFSNLALWLIFGSASQKWIASLKNDIKEEKIREAVFFKVNLEVLPHDKKKVLTYLFWKKKKCEKREKLY